MPIFLFSCFQLTEIKWNDELHFRWIEKTPGLFGSEGFRMLSPIKTGIGFIKTLTNKVIKENRHCFNGSGVAGDDINGNGHLDLPVSSMHGEAALYIDSG